MSWRWNDKKARDLRWQSVGVLRQMAEDLSDEVGRRFEAHEADADVEPPTFILLIDEMDGGS